jgi:hypothetical protein
MPPAYFTPKSAFERIGAPLVGTKFPEDTLGIYFGIGTANPE